MLLDEARSRRVCVVVVRLHTPSLEPTRERAATVQTEQEKPASKPQLHRPSLKPTRVQAAAAQTKSETESTQAHVVPVSTPQASTQAGTGLAAAERGVLAWKTAQTESAHPHAAKALAPMYTTCE